MNRNSFKNTDVLDVIYTWVKLKNKPDEINFAVKRKKNLENLWN